MNRPYYEQDGIQLWLGDCRDVLPTLADCSVDSIVTDPPYELGFMAKHWDRSGIAYQVEVWRECLRVLKPGGHLLAFGGSRTYHRLACAIEDAGFEIRDQMQWIHGQGFPKSLDISKAIDAAAGVEREVVGRTSGSEMTKANVLQGAQNRFTTEWDVVSRSAITDAAKQWNGWGTALKPAHEPIVMARKPLIGTVAENVLKHGTGGINVDGCRIPSGQDHADKCASVVGLDSNRNGNCFGEWNGEREDSFSNLGRWPSNVITDGSDEVVSLFPETTSGVYSGKRNEPKTKNAFGAFVLCDEDPATYGDSGSAARFFYCAKASKEDREEGLVDLPTRLKQEVYGDGLNSATKLDPRMHTPEGVAARPPTKNPHPTVKPTELMRYLCRLVTPPNGTVLDPFAGSGSTGKACALEDFKAILIEKEVEYCEIAKRRAQLRQRRLMFA